MTLNEYLTNDDNDVTKVFIPLYEKLKVINGNRRNFWIILYHMIK
jgi:hypothetical protein